MVIMPDASPSPVRRREDLDPRPRSRDRSWPPADAVAPLAAPVTDNHTHLPVPADPGGPGSEAPLSAAELVGRVIKNVS